MPGATEPSGLVERGNAPLAPSRKRSRRALPGITGTIGIACWKRRRPPPGGLLRSCIAPALNSSGIPCRHRSAPPGVRGRRSCSP
ncbi:hypothetical protein ABB22_12260 [Stenotrophomonas nitritireducens]|uniref:Uncharacterized protein n=1 Tax=Stenotrophomonas nitritireducens TaxID=83617 RepID=A0ABR5NHW6_9GAMM|nr:hypothetical protein ABB22_12260 [Stenotrophomonas nitritireducens]